MRHAAVYIPTPFSWSPHHPRDLVSTLVAGGFTPKKPSMFKVFVVLATLALANAYTCTIDPGSPFVNNTYVRVCAAERCRVNTAAPVSCRAACSWRRASDAALWIWMSRSRRRCGCPRRVPFCGAGAPCLPPTASRLVRAQCVWAVLGPSAAAGAVQECAGRGCGWHGRTPRWLTVWLPGLSCFRSAGKTVTIELAGTTTVELLAGVFKYQVYEDYVPVRVRVGLGWGVLIFFVASDCPSSTSFFARCADPRRHIRGCRAGLLLLLWTELRCVGQHPVLPVHDQGLQRWPAGRSDPGFHHGRPHGLHGHHPRRHPPAAEDCT